MCTCSVPCRPAQCSVYFCSFLGVLFWQRWQKTLWVYIVAGWMRTRLGPSWLPWGGGLNVLYRLWFRPTCKINRAAQWIGIEAGRLASSFSPLLASFLLFISFFVLFLFPSPSWHVPSDFPTVSAPSPPLLSSFFIFLVRSETLHFGPLPWRTVVKGKHVGCSETPSAFRASGTNKTLKQNSECAPPPQLQSHKVFENASVVTWERCVWIATTEGRDWGESSPQEVKEPCGDERASFPFLSARRLPPSTPAAQFLQNKEEGDATPFICQEKTNN